MSVAGDRLAAGGRPSVKATRTEFHPLIERWFRENLGEPTPPQTQGWEAIASGADTLIAAPTGSGKTLAAFL
ncbi:MAG: DEAD/DEAH box helicase, partial [Candidatus Methylomirabilales bacterium]